jgi:GTP pyrophosphokinase/guanosine-3',5'-bis(diphosphate) 3'-pyrophosphohydrolase
LVDSIQGSKNPSELLDNIKRELFSEEVFVFTPKGDIVVLPRGATPVDFAYHIHTEVGNHCAGAKVDGRIVPLNYKLRNGEQVEIITSPGKKPNPNWLNFVVTSKAKNRIKHYMKHLEREEFLNRGKRLFDKLKQKLSLEHEELIKLLSKKVRFKEEEELLIALGSGRLSIDKLANLLDRKRSKESKPQDAGSGTISIDGLRDIEYKVASCCMPVPGEEIYGVVVSGKGLVVHEKNCPNLKHLMSKYPEKVFRVDWQAEGKFKTRIRLLVRDRIGILSDITSQIAKSNSNIWKSNSVSLNDGTAVMEFTVDVKGSKHLRTLMDSLRSVEGVESCVRVYR